MTAEIDALIDKYAPDALTTAMSWLGSVALAPALFVVPAGLALAGVRRLVLLSTSRSPGRPQPS